MVAFDGRASSFPQLPRSDPDFRITTCFHGAVVGWIPSFWIDYYQRVSQVRPTSLGVPLLHRLRSPGGNDRLVAVNVYPTDYVGLTKYTPGGMGISVGATVIEPGTLVTPPRRLTFADNTLSLTRDSTDVAVYFGQLDSAHADHFMIDAVVEGTAIVIDGWLTDDDRVVLELRRPPLVTPPVPPSPASSR